MESIDLDQVNVFPREVYLKALNMFVSDHGAFLEDVKSVDGETLKLRLHKTKSGALLLGLRALINCIQESEENPTSENLKHLSKCYKKTRSELDAYLNSPLSKS
jgi:hypothetical protein